jgi:hypothetical protein
LLNVFAGVIASAIFIQEKGVLQPSVYVCVTLIGLLKMILLPGVLEKIKEDWFAYITELRPAPSIPNGAPSN